MEINDFINLFCSKGVMVVWHMSRLLPPEETIICLRARYQPITTFKWCRTTYLFFYVYVLGLCLYWQDSWRYDRKQVKRRGVTCSKETQAGTRTQVCCTKNKASVHVHACSTHWAKRLKILNILNTYIVTVIDWISFRQISNKHGRGGCCTNTQDYHKMWG